MSSNPTPWFPPVTMKTLLAWEGILSSVNVGFGGQYWVIVDERDILGELWFRSWICGDFWWDDDFFRQRTSRTWKMKTGLILLKL